MSERSVLRTLDEHNEAIKLPLRGSGTPAGVACNKCGEEMLVALLYSPEIVGVLCPGCKAVGAMHVGTL